MNYKILVGILIVGLLLVSSIYYFSISSNETEQNEEEIIIKNPKTGEVWNSVEEFRNRINWSELNG